MKLSDWLLESQRHLLARPFRLTIVAVVAWGFTVGNGMYLMSSFDNTPGRREAAPRFWPSTSTLSHSRDVSTLIIFAHPRCPCTFASLEQLRRVLSEATVPVRCSVVFLTPPQGDLDWTDSANVRLAKSLKSADVVFDTGAEIRRFCAKTSGQVLLYDAANQLSFSGGITIARGQRGDNGGVQSLNQLLNRQNPTMKAAPVFGCPLIPENSSSGDAVSCPRS